MKRGYVARREVLAAGVGLVALGASPFEVRASPPSQERTEWSAPDTVVSPRERLLFDFGWRFTFGHGTDPMKDLGFGFGQADFSKTGKFAFAKAGYDDSQWRPLDLPHDWGVELPFVHDDAGKGDDQLRSHGYKPIGRRYPETSVGWYRRAFDVPEADLGRRIWIEFDGAFRDVCVFLNGCFLGRSADGYTPFRYDLSDFLIYGGTNVVTVRVDASFGEGWFYEGAGIYRHVWLLKTAPVHLERWESVMRADLNGRDATLALSARVTNTTSEAKPVAVTWTILGPDGTDIGRVARSASIPGADSGDVAAQMVCKGVQLWSPDAPNLYTAVVTLEENEKISDGERISFGVRSAVFDAQEGFVLNGQQLKVRGVCNHQDHAGVGVAVPDQLQAFRVGVMQDMGCNAIRTSHNMPAPEVVEACDRLGVMIMCETRQMTSSAAGLQALETMVKRFRNSPSVILWSIGNEETLLQGPMAEQGERIARSMVDLCHRLDPTRPVTAAVNEDNEKGVSLAVDVVGFNYHQSEYPDAFHAKYPDRPIIGSETSSAISTRGEFLTNPARHTVSSYDGVVEWGETPESWWTFHATRAWEAGGFAWTGFDYRGEPTPYGWPSISSQFGIVDTCGFPKDYYYYYRAWWKNEPSLHLFPHWTWPGREGQTVPVYVYANVDEVELLVNGRSLGRKSVPHLGHVQWIATYQPGAIEARGFRNGRRVLTQRRETTGSASAIRLVPDRSIIRANGEDVCVVKVEVADIKGRAIPTADQKLAFRITGPGRIIGVGNGDPNCLESDKASCRSLFNGLAQIIVQSTTTPGTLFIEAFGDGADHLARGRTSVAVAACQRRAFVV